MANQIKPSVTNPTIAAIYQDIESGKLILKPDFQRKFVWTHAHQEAFIDTILKGYPFPEIYVCQGSIDTKKLKTIEHVIDGQQRLTTLKRYIEGGFDKPLKTIKSFEELKDDQEQFLSYQIVVRDLGKVDDDTIREVFKRINLTKFKLENIEIHNAVYDGEFIQTAKEILKNIPLEKYGVFQESEFTRMADLHFVLLVMSTVENAGYFPSDKDLERYVAEFNDEYKNSSHIKSLLIKVFAIIDDLDLPIDSIWFRKSCFFTLVVEIANNIQNIPNDFKGKLIKFEENLLAQKNNKGSDYATFYSYMYAGTTGRKARIERANIFKKAVFNIVDPFCTSEHLIKLSA
jgi:hypothetical protein